MEGLLYQLAAGVVAGAYYGGFALALVMVHRATGHINFAQGEMATFATFIALYVILAGYPFFIAVVVAIGVSVVLGVVIEMTLIKRLGEKSALRFVIVTIGLFMLLNGSSGFLFGYSAMPMESPFAGLPIGTKYLSAHEVGSLLVIAALLGLLFLVFRYTKFGLAMRAAAVNPTSARLVGVNVDLVRAVVWGAAAAIGTVIGLLVAPVFFIEPNLMLGVLVYGFAAALVGGVDNPWGAVAGGLFVGIIENLAGAYLVGTELKLTVALTIIIAILLVRPAGVFGQTIVRRL
jgi:branched-chain amino acid transport system permease protein